MPAALTIIRINDGGSGDDDAAQQNGEAPKFQDFRRDFIGFAAVTEEYVQEAVPEGGW